MSNHINFSANAIQEARITDETTIKLFDIPRYKPISLGSTVSSKGGLITYVFEDFQATKRENLFKSSQLFEALFVDISGPKFKDKKVTLGNLYRPGRNNSSTSIK